jgi:hypothetical protein
MKLETQQNWFHEFWSNIELDGTLKAQPTTEPACLGPVNSDQTGQAQGVGWLGLAWPRAASRPMTCGHRARHRAAGHA